MTKLMVAGCSFSDRPSNNLAYGDHLAKHLNAEYIHQAASAGSNTRIWRVVTNAVMNGVITSDDILVIQYTEITRDEIWSEHRGTVDNGYEPYTHGGHLLRIKYNTALSQSSNDSEFLKIYIEQHMLPEYAHEKASVFNFNFQNMLYVHKIPTIFVKAMSYGRELHNENHFNFPEYNYTREMLIGLDHPQSPTNLGHMNNTGHKYVAEQLHQLCVKEFNDT
jgi:hypothetical protein